MTEVKWIEVACDWCGSNDSDLLFEGPDRLMGLHGQFRMVRCRHCGLLRQSPRFAWESLKAYYPLDYSPHVPLIREEPSVLRRLDRRYGVWKQMRSIEHFQRGGRLLDIGCGTGVFMEEAQRSGRWVVEGIEPAEKAAAYARSALGVNIYVGRFSDINLPVASFDVITMWNVLEHLEYPIADLRRAHQMLRENGLLVFAIPSVESLAARIFGPYWVGWDLPRHLYLFPRPVLQEILGKLGYCIVADRCISGSYSTLRDSLEFWTRAWNPSNHAPMRWLLQLYRSFPIRFGLGLPLWILDRLKLTSVVTIFARKMSS
jgi:SAM-dependent methyltransferase